MAYITSEQVAEKRAEIKKSFPGWKFSITREDYSCIIVKILSAPLDFPLVNDGKTYQQLHGHTFENYFTNSSLYFKACAIASNVDIRASCFPFSISHKVAYLIPDKEANFLIVSRCFFLISFILLCMINYLYFLNFN